MRTPGCRWTLGLHKCKCYLLVAQADTKGTRKQACSYEYAEQIIVMNTSSKHMFTSLVVGFLLCSARRSRSKCGCTGAICASFLLKVFARVSF